jgi:hypothetical protein
MERSPPTDLKDSRMEVNHAALQRYMSVFLEMETRKKVYVGRLSVIFENGVG